MCKTAFNKHHHIFQTILGLGLYTFLFWLAMYFFGFGTEAIIIIVSLLIPQVRIITLLEITDSLFMFHLIIMMVNFSIMVFVTFLTAKFGVHAQLVYSVIAGLIMRTLFEVLKRAMR